MSEVTVIGLDIAKSVFQAHGADARGQQLFSRRITRGKVLEFFEDQPSCLVALEACGGAHHWARELTRMGHDVRLVPPAYVKLYVKRQKNDAADAEAICEAVTRPNMRFVPVKSEEQQGVLVLHRSRDLLMRQRTMILNAIRAHLAEFGVIAAQGSRKAIELITRLREGEGVEVPALARAALMALSAQLDGIASQIQGVERQLMAWHRQNAASQRLETIPGVGLITATALAASVPDPSVFRSGRQFAAWLGLVPRQNSAGGKERLGRVSKMGNGYLRRLLAVGATSVSRRAETSDSRTGHWVRSLLERKPARLVTVAIANKTARTAWALLIRGESYRAAAAA